MSERFSQRKSTWWRTWPVAVSLAALMLSACSGTAAVGTVSAATNRAVVAAAATERSVTAPAALTQPAPAVDTAALELALAPQVSQTAIALGKTTTVSGPGAMVDGSTVTITAGGTYHFSGVLDDGQIVVDSGDSTTVQLILDGARITSATSAPIYVKRADTTAIVLANGSDNYVADGTAYVFADAQTNEPDAAIFSTSDLIIGGDGSLTVVASYNDGIASRDELTIAGGTINVTAKSDGIKGKDSLTVYDGAITVKAGTEGLQSSNDEDADKGYVVVEAGTLDVTAGRDGIQGETRVVVNGGRVNITSGGGSANTANNGAAAPSAKGINAGVDLTIAGGTIVVDSADDGLHSNNSLRIDGGNVSIASGDDGVHADTTLTIYGGAVDITTSYEGIESAAIAINDGQIRIVARNDGMNAASGTAGGAPVGRPGQSSNANNSLSINGGYIVVDAAGDGLDANGAIAMRGGMVIVHGPIVNNEGPLDYDRGFAISGGTVIAVGSAGMAQAPDTTSTQNSVMVNLPAVQPAGTAVHIAAADGANIVTFVPTKSYQSVVVSSPALQRGETYTVYVGGSATGTVADGLYTGGAYTAGTQAGTFIISGVVTSVGSTPRGAFPGRPRG